MPHPPLPRSASRFLPLAACLALLVLYAVLAWTAVLGKSATYDEPLSVTSAYAAGRLHDYRVDYEHPPLWKYWAWLGNVGRPVHADLDSKYWTGMGENAMQKWWFAHGLLDQWGNDGHSLERHSRAMMLVLAVGVGALLAGWSWRMGGAVAGVVAVALFAFDPNFLGHGPLVKNDVAMAGITLAVIAATWWVGRRASAWSVGLLALACGVALVIKMSALVLGPIVAVLLLVRAIAGPWTLGRRTLSTTGSRIALAVGIGVLSLAVSIAVIWATYGFRYSASPDPRFHLDMGQLVRMAALRSYFAQDPTHRPTEEQLAHWDPGLLARTTLELNRLHALPEAWLGGLLFTVRTVIGENSYLNGEVYYGGKWYYFLNAMAYKTPVATLFAFALAGGCIGVELSRRRTPSSRPKPSSQPASQSQSPAEATAPSRLDSWTLLCLAVPLAGLFLTSFASSLDLGIRYILPVYPLLYAGVGLVAAEAWCRPRARLVIGILAVVLAAESLAAYPNYIAFFNAPASRMSHGLWLLGDSNLDWGQDLPALAKWQKAHSEDELYLSYFGTDDPASYGIRYHNLPAGYLFGPPPEWPTQGRVIFAISATNLQGIYLRKDLYREFREARPEDVLNGTIYLYRPAGEPGAPPLSVPSPTTP